MANREGRSRGASSAGTAERPADEQRIRRAIVFINRHARAIREQARGIHGDLLAIGKYLLKEFFGDDPRQVRDRSKLKTNSFRDFAGRREVEMSYTSLWRAVQLAVDERQPGGSGVPAELSPSHAIELLALGHPRDRRDLGDRAVRDAWPVRRLRDEVRRRRGLEPREGGRAGGDASRRAGDAVAGRRSPGPAGAELPTGPAAGPGAGGGGAPAPPTPAEGGSRTGGGRGGGTAPAEPQQSPLELVRRHLRAVLAAADDGILAPETIDDLPPAALGELTALLRQTVRALHRSLGAAEGKPEEDLRQADRPAPDRQRERARDTERRPRPPGRPPRARERHRARRPR
jgi:hypothetical protein